MLILGNEENNLGDTGGQHKKNLIDNEEISWNQDQKIGKIKRDAVEMEAISVGVMRQLDRQTGQIKHISHKVNDINGNLEESNSLLDGMRRRVNRNKKIMVLFAIIVIVAFLAYFMYKIFLKHN